MRPRCGHPRLPALRTYGRDRTPNGPGQADQAAAAVHRLPDGFPRLRRNHAAGQLRRVHQRWPQQPRAAAGADAGLPGQGARNDRG